MTQYRNWILFVVGVICISGCQSKEPAVDPDQPVVIAPVDTREGKVGSTPKTVSKTASISHVASNRVRSVFESLRPGTGSGSVPSSPATNRQLGQLLNAMQSYQYRHNVFPAIDGTGLPDSSTGLSWRVHVLPHLGEENMQLYHEFHLEEPWDSPHNKTLLTRMPGVFGRSIDGKTRIHVFTGEGAPFQSNKGLTTQRVHDDTTNTIMFAEAGLAQADYWTKPSGLVFNQDEPAQVLGEDGEDVDEFRAAILLISKSSSRLTSRLVRVRAKHPSLASLIMGRAGRVPDGIIVRPETQALVIPEQELPELLSLDDNVGWSFISESAVAAIVVHPRRLMEHPVASEFFDLLARNKFAYLNTVLDKIGVHFNEVEEIQTIVLDNKYKALSIDRWGIRAIACSDGLET